MCKVKTPSAPTVEPAKEHAASRTPDGDAARSTVARRQSDQRRAGYQTILTSGSGVSNFAPTAGKTLLGG